MRAAMEEKIPAAVICGVGDKKFINICKRLFDTETKPIPLIKNNADFNDIFNEDALPKHICSLKWFIRNPNEILTAGVSDISPIQKLESMRKIICGSSLDDSIHSKAILLAALDTLDLKMAQSQTTSNLIPFQPESEWFIERTERIDRQWFETPTVEDHRSFLFLEGISDLSATIRLSIENKESPLIGISTSPINEGDQYAKHDKALLGFWYFPIPKSIDYSKRFYITVSIFSSSIELNSRELYRLYKYLVIKLGTGYFRIQASAFYKGEYIFNFSPVDHLDSKTAEGEVDCIGVPIHFDIETKISVKIFPAK